MRAFFREWWLFALGALLIVGGLGSWAWSSIQERRTIEEASALAVVLRMTPVSRIADIGAGDGRFTVELARRHLTDGYVFATDVDVDALRGIGRAASDAGLDNVTIIEGRAEATGLPPSCCDGVVLRRVYHHLTAPVPFVADLFSAVRSGGRVAVVDFESNGLLPLVAPVVGVPRDRGGHGVPPRVIVSELTAAGFILVEEHETWLSGGFCLVFEKP